MSLPPNLNAGRRSLVSSESSREQEAVQPQRLIKQPGRITRWRQDNPKTLGAAIYGISLLVLAIIAALILGLLVYFGVTSLTEIFNWFRSLNAVSHLYCPLVLGSIVYVCICWAVLTKKERDNQIRTMEAEVEPSDRERRM